MPKVTIHDSSETASEKLAAETRREQTVTDSRGRKITLRKPELLDEFRAVEAVGDAAKNTVWMDMYIPLIYVVAIDGDQIFMPASKLEAEALISRIASDGYRAVMKGINALNADAEKDESAAKN